MVHGIEPHCRPGQQKVKELRDGAWPEPGQWATLQTQTAQTQGTDPVAGQDLGPPDSCVKLQLSSRQLLHGQDQAHAVASDNMRQAGTDLGGESGHCPRNSSDS